MTSTRTECDGAGLVEHAGARTTLGLWCALFVLFATSVAATVYYCATMSGGMDMPGGWSMSMMWMPMAGQTWAGAAVMFMLMWLAMMVAMMLPSALPMIFGYHAMQSRDGGKMVAARTLWMTGGYFFVWSAAGAVIFVAGIFYAMAVMRWTALSLAMPRIFGATMVAAGLLQFMPWTMAGLRCCRGSTKCDGPAPAWRTGIRRGISCVACCSGPTLVLLALGMMNPAVILLVTAVIAMEKLLPRPELIVRILGIVAVAAGVVMTAGG